MQTINGQLRHDLRGAAVNISGFHAECSLAVTELRQLLEAHLDSLPEPVRIELMQLIDDDVQACLGFLGSSIAQLDVVIDGAGDVAAAADTDAD